MVPSLGITSSLGADPSAPVGTNGLALGASPTVSPVPNGITGTIAIPSTSSGAGGVFDRRDFAIGNVRIARDLRRRGDGTGQRNHDSWRHGDAGNIDILGNIDVDRHLGDVGGVDILGYDGHVGIVGYVRLRLKQHCRIVEVQRQRRSTVARRQQPAALEPEFRWHLTRLAILGSAPPRRYRRQT